MIAARSGRTAITNILLEGEHIDLNIQENVSVLLQAPNAFITRSTKVLNPRRKYSISCVIRQCACAEIGHASRVAV